MASQSDGGSPLGAAFAPFKPVMWMAIIGVVGLALAVGWMAMGKGPTKTARPPIVLSAADAGDGLKVGVDVMVGHWGGPELYPAEFRNPDANVRYMCEVRFKQGVALRGQATLRLPAPIGLKLPMAEPTGPGAMTVCEFMREGRFWQPRARTWVGTPDTLFETLISQPGYYGIVEITGSQMLPTLTPDNPKKDPNEGKPKPPAETGEPGVAKPDPSKYRFAPVMRRTLSGGWEEVTDFRLCITPEKNPVRIDEVPVVTLWGEVPKTLSGTQTAQWYLSEADAESDFPHEVRLLSDADAFRFRIPQTLLAGDYVIVFRIVDTVSDEMLGVIYEAKIPVTITGP